MNETIEIALAAFLHDVGKPLQRAEFPLSDQAKRLENILCPTHQHGYPTHKHVLWTNDFIEGHMQWLPGELDKARINRIASQHHRPSDPEDYVVTEADCLASGHDRRDRDVGQSTGFKKVAMASVFGRLRLKSGEAHRAGIHLPQRLAPDVGLFPQPDPDRSLVDDYRQLMNHCVEEIDKWPQLPLTMVCPAIESFSRRYFSFVPSSTIDEPDVSLHDHARVTASIAAALASYHQQTDSMTERSIRDRSKQKFRLISGDLSGIQRYLFDMPTEGRRGSARAYRARSFYPSVA